MIIVRSYKILQMFLLFSALVFPRIAYSQTVSHLDSAGLLRSGFDEGKDAGRPCVSYKSAQATRDCIADNSWMSEELSSLGPRGDMIAHVREQTLQILQSENTCAAWFGEAEPDVADVFLSLHYDIDANGTANIYGFTDNFGDVLFKHPWGARSVEGSGRNSFIQLNGNGPFFVRKTRVLPSDPSSHLMLPEQPQGTLIGPYEGATAQAQITIMLHELGHIVGRLPRDDNSWNGRSSENTREVLRHCKKEIRQMARQELH